MHISQTYAENLLVAREGYPLWVPEPLANLPSDYQATGVRIGDVGVISKEGAFSMLFNICCPADDPTNLYGGVPADFEHIEAGPVRSVPAYFNRRGAFVHSSDIKTRNIAFEAGADAALIPAGVEAGVEFSLTTSQGAVLALPRGGARQDAQNLGAFEAQIDRHGISWYKYALNCGWQFDNGELYLVTGVDKAPIWGALAFCNSQRSHNVSFRLATTMTNSGLSHEYLWQHLAGQSARQGPDAAAALFDDNAAPVENQCVFLRGFRIMVRDEPWMRMLGIGVKAVNFANPGSFKGSISSLTHARPLRGSFRNSRTMDSSQAQGESPQDDPYSVVASQPGKDPRSAMPDHPGDDMVTEDDNDLVGNQENLDIDESASSQYVGPGSEVTYHPSDAHNRHTLSQRPDRDIAFTHDTVWMYSAGDVNAVNNSTSDASSSIVAKSPPEVLGTSSAMIDRVGDINAATITNDTSKPRQVLPMINERSSGKLAAQTKVADHWKPRLRNRVNSYGWPTPTYKLVPTDAKGTMWRCTVFMNGYDYGTANSPNQYEAAELAAQQAFIELDREGMPQFVSKR
ncbi:hypothetical protein BD626DRAFT_494914 [Schizophyllum amplum]|uniref:DRBM domain-containing protein n=1 Tax=Schizophyllum amplum TaxID=97359 RepID=A0A550CFQ2_9AGAR|nr:hypothetical protein BD626DRAFT_494914 [Auriculariopsis ampla]